MTPEIILGPPGTGKTTSLLKEARAELARGTHPSEIGFLTFTKKAAGEAIARACEEFGYERNDLRYFRTIHSLCFQSLGVNNGDVLEGKKMLEFGDWIGESISETRFLDEGSTFGFTPADRALFMENLARVKCVPLRKQYDSNCDNIDWDLVERISRGLAQFKKDRHLVDFTDMLTQYVERGSAPRLKVLFVDEGQDLSQLQWRVILFLAKSAERLVFAGDDDQAIYKWAGADVDYFVDMVGAVRVLGQSYRVPRRVQAISSEIISHVRKRRPKEWAPKDTSGTVSRVQSVWDADFEGKDILILGRNAFCLQPVLSHLRKEGIVYSWRGRNSVHAGILEAIVSWEKLRAGGSILSDEARKMYEYFSSGRGVRRGYKTLPGFANEQPVTLQTLRERGGLLQDGIWHEAMDRIPEDDKFYILRARRRGEQLRKEPRVHISTIHGAKGGQAEHVVLLRDMASRTYEEYLQNPEDEHRVWYVGVTRAKERLTIVAPRSKKQYDL